MKTASSQKADELLTLTYSGRVQEHDVTNMQQSLPLSSETQYKIHFIAFLYLVDRRGEQLIRAKFNKFILKTENLVELMLLKA